MNLLGCLCRREYVAKVLTTSVPELTQADAYVIMQKAHKSGMAVVGVWVLEVCEAYCDLLRNGGLTIATPIIGPLRRATLVIH